MPEAHLEHSAGQHPAGQHAVEQYRRWFRYEQDSHAKCLASLHGVPEPLRLASGFQKAVDLTAHLIAARRLWLLRFGVASDGPRSLSELFPRQALLGDLSPALKRMEAAWEPWLQQLTAAELARVFEYSGVGSDQRYRSSVEDVLTQLFGHSWYHRGQIALLLRSIGAEPAVTDFVFWSREVLPAGGEA